MAVKRHFVVFLSKGTRQEWSTLPLSAVPTLKGHVRLFLILSHLKKLYPKFPSIPFPLSLLLSFALGLKLQTN